MHGFITLLLIIRCIIPLPAVSADRTTSTLLIRARSLDYVATSTAEPVSRATDLGPTVASNDENLDARAWSLAASAPRDSTSKRSPGNRLRRLFCCARDSACCGRAPKQPSATLPSRPAQRGTWDLSFQRLQQARADQARHRAERQLEAVAEDAGEEARATAAGALGRTELSTQEIHDAMMEFRAKWRDAAGDSHGAEDPRTAEEPHVVEDSRAAESSGAAPDPPTGHTIADGLRRIDDAMREIELREGLLDTKYTITGLDTGYSTVGTEAEAEAEAEAAPRRNRASDTIAQAGARFIDDMTDSSSSESLDGLESGVKLA